MNGLPPSTGACHAWPTKIRYSGNATITDSGQFMTTSSVAAAREVSGHNGPLGTRISVFAVWGMSDGVAFFDVYQTMSWLASLTTGVHAMCFEQALHVPFVPECIWASNTGNAVTERSRKGTPG